MGKQTTKKKSSAQIIFGEQPAQTPKQGLGEQHDVILVLL